MITKKQKVLILDAYNNFIRNFVVDPSVGTDGLHIGGTKGFLKSLQKIVRETSPSQIIVVWDGSNGSKRKRKMFSEYKDGRKPTHLNRNIKNLSPDEEEENKHIQLSKLIEYLNLCPIIQFMIDNVEADDVIARICNLRSLAGQIKIIVSSDKDFFQLCDDETIILRPIQNEIMNKKRVVDKFGIHPNNFTLARAIAGDKSDNLDGVGGAGLITVAKRFEFLKEEKSYNLDEIYMFCQNNKGKFKVYDDILNAKDKVEMNYKIMQLYVPNMPPQIAKIIKDTIEDFVPEFNQTDIIKKMLADGMTDYKWDVLFQNFKFICAASKNFKI